MNVEPLDITEYYEVAVRAWTAEALPPLDNIRVTLEPNMTKAFGRAMGKCFRRRNGRIVRRSYYAITICRPWMMALVKSAGKEGMLAQFRDTVLHELAHIAMFYTYPNIRVQPHGGQWQSLARRVGIRPSPCAWEKDEDTVTDEINVTWAQVKKTKNGG